MLPNPRYERKIIATGLSLPEVLALVSRHPAGFRQSYPARIVNNLYLDTPSLSAYRDHVNGSSCRVKTRIRWYGAPVAQIPAPVLEWKLKSGQLSGKTSTPLPPIQLNRGGAKGAFEPLLRSSAVPEAVRASVQSLHSSLLNSYRRSYFVSADRRFRLTVDSELNFAHPHHAGCFEESPLVIIEIKYAPAEADAAPRMTNAFPFRVSRCSKYLLGIQELNRGR